MHSTDVMGIWVYDMHEVPMTAYFSKVNKENRPKENSKVERRSQVVEIGMNQIDSTPGKCHV